jgi:hypothetical protein
MERALWLEQMRYVQPKTAFSRFPRVHRADFEVHKGSVRPVRHSPGNDGVDGAPNGISVARWSLSNPI